MAKNTGRALSDNDVQNVSGGAYVITSNPDKSNSFAVMANGKMLKSFPTVAEATEFMSFLERDKDKLMVKIGKGNKESIVIDKTMTAE